MDQIVQIHVYGQILVNPHGDRLHQRHVFQHYPVAPRELGSLCGGLRSRRIGLSRVPARAGLYRLRGNALAAIGNRAQRSLRYLSDRRRSLYSGRSSHLRSHRHYLASSWSVSVNASLSARPGPSAALKKSGVPADLMNAPRTGGLQFRISDKTGSPVRRTEVI